MKCSISLFKLFTNCIVKRIEGDYIKMRFFENIRDFFYNSIFHSFYDLWIINFPRNDIKREIVERHCLWELDKNIFCGNPLECHIKALITNIHL